MAITWTNIDNGETGLSIRNKLNNFNSSATISVNTNSSNINDLQVLVNTLETDKSDITHIHTSLPDLLLTPALVEPTYNEGKIYYKDGTLNVQGVYDDVVLNVGRETHIRVVNNSGVAITNGQVVTNNGILSGIPGIRLAIADSFLNGKIFGVATRDIGINEVGIITSFGILHNMDTTGYTTGIPIYLSDTIPGALTNTAPNIANQVGGILTVDALTGSMFIDIDNNINFPTQLGFLQGQTIGAYSLTVTPQNIVNYTNSGSSLSSVDETSGIITIDKAGSFRINFTTTLSFPDLASTRLVKIECYNITQATSVFQYTKNLPKNSITDSVNFNWPTIVSNDGDQFVIRLTGAPDVIVTLTSVSFDIESISIVV